MDAVIVSSPIHLHEEACLEAFARGRHVLCEKPLSNTAASARRIVDAAIAARKTLAEIQELIGADTLAFLSLDGMMRAIIGRDAGDDDGYCNACFTGRYPISVGDAQAKLAFEGVLS